MWVCRGTNEVDQRRFPDSTETRDVINFPRLYRECDVLEGCPHYGQSPEPTDSAIRPQSQFRPADDPFSHYLHSFDDVSRAFLRSGRDGHRTTLLAIPATIRPLIDSCSIRPRFQITPIQYQVYGPRGYHRRQCRRHRTGRRPDARFRWTGSDARYRRLRALHLVPLSFSRTSVSFHRSTSIQRWRSRYAVSASGSSGTSLP